MFVKGKADSYCSVVACRPLLLLFCLVKLLQMVAACTKCDKRPGYVKGLGLRPSSSIRTTSEFALKALGLRPSSSATTHEYVSCLETKIEAQNETIEKLLEANRQQQKINASMMEFLIEKGYTGHVGSAETSSND
ncbi:hypothetical protein RHSIM_Rhsim01G0231300 [Rhododendron simsii]|uniref:Uncharacterized protein n=1 Tax=Rhododendron simsii TaxID=118357 RepID=A0A834HG05_RHOSS|nr:hypothetical protein RHSIM_Rhsim01G0231300 [Rhododendron simsii]